MKNDITLPAEFVSMNEIPVPVATIKRERMEEILREAIEADRLLQGAQDKAYQAAAAQRPAPNEIFAVVIDRMYEGEGPSLAHWNGEHYQFSDGDCFEREGDMLDDCRALWLTDHQLEKRLINIQADTGDQKIPGPCSLGVGCDEMGVCYAEAHNQPDMCGKPQQAVEPMSDSSDATHLCTSEQRVIGKIVLDKDRHPRAVLSTGYDENGDQWKDGAPIYAAPQIAKQDRGAPAALPPQIRYALELYSGGTYAYPGTRSEIEKYEQSPDWEEHGEDYSGRPRFILTTNRADDAIDALTEWEDVASQPAEPAEWESKIQSAIETLTALAHRARHDEGAGFQVGGIRYGDLLSVSEGLKGLVCFAPSLQVSVEFADILKLEADTADRTGKMLKNWLQRMEDTNWDVDGSGGPDDLTLSDLRTMSESLRKIETAIRSAHALCSQAQPQKPTCTAKSPLNFGDEK